jgi:hypothetical protein
LSKGFHIASGDVKPDKRFVVYSGKDRFTLLENIEAISLHDLMQEILNK